MSGLTTSLPGATSRPHSPALGVVGGMGERVDALAAEAAVAHRVWQLNTVQHTAGVGSGRSLLSGCPLWAPGV